jgi:mannose-6-phosphate isomerase-like protein (cupin superfamily)
MERKIYNPVQKDYVTFIHLASETNGQSTVVEVELAAGGGVGLHYHKTYSEKFTCLEGELQVQLDDQTTTLLPNEEATAKPLINHRFYNRSNWVCRFRVELNPGSMGFEQSLQIGYGLARDGQTRSNGMPKDPLILSWLFEVSESNLKGWRSILEFVLRWQAKRARAKGIDKRLIEQYVRF